MDLKVMLGTFGLVFLAELGDKTQLTAFMFAATKQKPLAVFIGASVALVLSTLIAVALGGLLGRVANPQVIKGVAAALFLVMGVLLAVEVARGKAPEKEVEAAAPSLPARMALAMAVEFEEGSVADYAAQAREAQDPGVKELLTFLAEEERRQLARMRSLAARKPEPVEPEAPVPELPELHTINGHLDMGVLESAVHHERAMAAFYEALAGHMPTASMKNVVLGLAKEERQHLAKLEHIARNRA